jgi:hypothetical protein
MLIAIGLLFAVIPKSSELSVFNWIVGSLLILVCVFDFCFQVTIATKVIYLKLKSQ